MVGCDVQVWGWMLLPDWPPWCHGLTSVPWDYLLF